MSTYYGLRCRNDDAETACGTPSYNTAELSALARAAGTIKQFNEGLAGEARGLLALTPDFAWEESWNETTPMLIEFLIQHADHDIVLLDEYGRTRDLEPERSGGDGG